MPLYEIEERHPLKQGLKLVSLAGIFGAIGVLKKDIH